MGREDALLEFFFFHGVDNDLAFVVVKRGEHECLCETLRDLINLVLFLDNHSWLERFFLIELAEGLRGNGCSLRGRFALLLRGWQVINVVVVVVFFVAACFFLSVLMLMMRTPMRMMFLEATQAQVDWLEILFGVVFHGVEGDYDQAKK